MKRWKLIILVIVAFLAGRLALHLSEPRYQHRTLSQWLETYHDAAGPRKGDFRNLKASPESRATAIHAISQSGTNAVPFLLRKISSRDSVPERFKDLRSLIRFRFTDPDSERSLALDGFEILGKDASGAEPGLVKLTADSAAEVRLCALYALDKIQSKREIFLPTLLQKLRDSDLDVRRAAALILRRSYPEEAEQTAIYKMFPELVRQSSTQNAATVSPVVK